MTLTSLFHRDISNLTARDRLLVGVGCALLAQVAFVVAGASMPKMGVATKLTGVLTLLGVAFLGVSVEPGLTRRLGGDEWDDLSTGRQALAAFVMALVAIVAYGVVSIGGGVVLDALV